MKSHAYFNKKIVPLEEAKVSVMTHALNYGTACFEGIRGNWNAEKEEIYIFRMAEHYERLERSSKLMRIEMTHTVEELCNITIELIKKSDCYEDVYIRPLTYKSGLVIGVRVHNIDDDLCIYVAPFGPYLDLELGAKCCTSKWRRVSDTMMPIQAKACGLYINSALAKTYACESGFDEAILLTSNGYVSDGSGENIFAVINGQLVTPPPSDDILIGITRDSVITLAREELGIETVERSITRSELYCADESFLTGTAAHLTPVVEVDHNKLGDGRIGKITRQLQKLYMDIELGKNPKYLHWLTPVYGK
ncbi:MAG: branched-chain amino acid transaminase [Dehalococcoidia bacterium]|nr:branched-chain amino acid transaminase [Dehalococcoidia bacterium]